MKRVYLTAAVMLICICSFAQSGTWSGKLNVQGATLPLVFHFDDECRVDSPAQGVKGIPAQLERTAVGVIVRMPMLNARFEGIYMVRSIVGTFTQSNMSFPLTLTPGEIWCSRPQTPVPPFPYKTEDVEFINGDAVLKGTLVTPDDASRDTPVVIMVTGSGQQNRDEEIYGHKPFAVIADALARGGIASLRYDDRGAGESAGDVASATTDDFKNDASAGLELLRSRFDRVGVLGHSEGGTIALMLAAEGKADFAVSLAGMVQSGGDALLYQNKVVLSQAGYPAEVVNEYCRALERVFAGENEIEGYVLPARLKDNLKAVVLQCGSPWMKHFISSDISGSLESITCPVLALNGTLDMQVDCESNLGIIRERLGGAEASALNEIRSIEGVNHLFQHCLTGAVSEYSEIEETISPEVLEIILRWLRSLY